MRWVTRAHVKGGPGGLSVANHQFRGSAGRFIFESFRIETGYARSQGGTGLALARRLVELMGGALTVACAPGQGSTFTVSLPAARHAGNGEWR